MTPSKQAMDLKELRKIAMAATPGEWDARISPAWNEYAISACARTHQQSPRQGEQRDKANADADHIAAFSPATALALLDELERCRAALSIQVITEEVI